MIRFDYSPYGRGTGALKRDIKFGIKQQTGVGEPGKPSDKTHRSQNGFYLYKTLQIAAMDTLETFEIPSLAI